jgi:hypothetical protein
MGFKASLGNQGCSYGGEVKGDTPPPSQKKSAKPLSDLVGKFNAINIICNDVNQESDE